MIILLGFPKSGTTSFQKLFTDLGYTSAHWCHEHIHLGTAIRDNKKHGRSLLYNISVDCITQMDICISQQEAYWPQIVDYEQLYYENPDSVFILNQIPLSFIKKMA